MEWRTVSMRASAIDGVGRPATGRTLFGKIWAAHVVSERPGHPAVLYVDLHLVHGGTSVQAFDTLRASTT